MSGDDKASCERISWKSKLSICLAGFYFVGLCICCFLMCVGLHESSRVLFSTHVVTVDSLTTHCQRRKSPALWKGSAISEIIRV